MARLQASDRIRVAPSHSGRRTIDVRFRRASTLVFLPLMIVLAMPSGAAAVNEFSAGYRVRSTADLDGVRGAQGIRTSPGTVNGVAYAHPVQMDVGSQGTSFIGIGTYNGAGTTDANCPNDYDAGWSGYYDGEIGGVYFCTKFADDAWVAGSSPSFRIERDCQLGGNIVWGVYFAGTQRACLNSGAAGATKTGASLEVVSNDGADRNIDVKYTSLDVNFTSGSAWNTFSHNATYVDPNYSFGAVSNTAFNTFLSPLD